MSDAYKNIKQGLEDALAHAKGKDAGARVHQVEVPEPDVAAMRAQAGLSQAEFARSIGVPPRLGTGATQTGWPSTRVTGLDRETSGYCSG